METTAGAQQLQWCGDMHPCNFWKSYIVFVSKHNIITIMIIFKMADDIKGLVAYACSFLKFQIIILKKKSAKDFTFFASNIGLDQ